MCCRISSGSQCICTSMSSKQYNLKHKRGRNPKIPINSKKSARKIGKLKIKKVLLLLFKEKYGGVSPIFRTLILMNLKEIDLCCNIFLGSRCIRFIRSTRHNKFAQRNSRKLLKVPYKVCGIILNC